ncbi:ABC transporter ATP-binding protein [Pseudorhodoplanes sp.]|uniref:ABC transporter ATP-binding protein n=1 Tax=Pseudorhodoplanes sp. TaxID=1934341 RepID=UPI003D0EEC1B
MSAPYVLETRAMTKDFNGFVAVNNVNLKVRQGTIHAIIGPNGAGKTTVFNLLTKFHRPNSGQILYKGHDITPLDPASIARSGIVRSFQISAVFPHMTVLENVQVALQRKLGFSFQFWKSARVLDQTNSRAMELLEAVGLSDFARQAVVDLPYGRKRALEIATTFALDPKLVLLDEPTQGIGHEHVGRITALIRKMAQGNTVLIVEHNLNVVAELSDTITVLARGAVLAEGPYSEISGNAAVREAYIGEARS